MHLTSKITPRVLWRVFDDGASKLRSRTVPQAPYGSVIAADGEASANQTGVSKASGVAGADGVSSNDMVGTSA